MFFKKNKGKIFGVDFSNNERRAMEKEFAKEFAEFDKKHADEIDALVLWVLHEEFGFGPGRMRRFYHAFMPAMQQLLKRYEMEEGEQVWLCTHMVENYLQSYGMSFDDIKKEAGVCK